MFFDKNFEMFRFYTAMITKKTSMYEMEII